MTEVQRASEIFWRSVKRNMSDAKASARARVLLVFALARFTPVKLLPFAFSALANLSLLVPFSISVMTPVRVEFCGILEVLNRDVADIVGVGGYAVLEAGSPSLLLGNSDIFVLVVSVYVGLIRAEVDEFEVLYVDEKLKAVKDEFAVVDSKTSLFSPAGKASADWITSRLATPRASRGRIMRSLLSKW